MIVMTAKCNAVFMQGRVMPGGVIGVIRMPLISQSDRVMRCSFFKQRIASETAGRTEGRA